MKTRGFISAMFTFFALCTSSAMLGQRQPITPQKVDSILQVVTAMEKDIEAIKILTSNAGKNRYAASTRKLIDKAIVISIETEDAEMLANSYYSLGNFHFYNAQLDSATTYLDTSASYIEDDAFPFLRSGIYATKGGIAKKQDAISQSIVYTMRAKEILDKIDTTTLTPELKKKRKGQNLVLSNSLANLYFKTEDYETSIIYYDLANEAALSLNDFYGAGVITSNKGSLLLEMDRHHEALEALEKGKELKEKAGAPVLSLGLSNLNIGAAHLELGDVDKAMKNFNEAMAIFEEKNHAPSIAEVLPLRGTLHIKQGNLDLAVADCERAKTLINSIEVPELKSAACECLYDAYKRKGDFEKALLNFEEYSQAREAILNKENIKKLTQIEMQYDFNKKQEEQLEILQREKRLKRNILIGLIALAIFSVVVILFLRKRMQYKNRLAMQNEALQQQKITELQQKNKLLAMNSMIEGQEAERLRIAKDLHDSLGGLLSTVKAHFTTIQNEIEQLSALNLTEKTNNLIDEACIEVRRISHNMMPHALSISGLQGAIEDLGNHLKEQGYHVQVEISNLQKTIEPTREVMVYRLVQEIISNIRKHADAKNILIQLVGHKQEMNILLEDDGKGFNIEEAKAKGGLGLKSINSRVAYLDGTIDWDSEPSKGTSITINIPIS